MWSKQHSSQIHTVMLYRLIQKVTNVEEGDLLVHCFNSPGIGGVVGIKVIVSETV